MAVHVGVRGPGHLSRALGLPAAIIAAASPVWNPLDKHADITLSESNLRLTGTTATDRGVRGTTSKSAGKWYFLTEVVVLGNNVSGIGNAAAALTTYVGAGVGSYGYATSGNVLNSGGVVASASTYTTGDLIGVAVDFTALKLWFAKNGVWTSGDPAAATGGYTIASDTYFPMGGASSSGGSHRFKKTNIAPSGFGLWE